MSSEVRNLRLANDYHELCNMRGKLLSWKVLSGAPPYVEEYELYININAPISTIPQFRPTHVVKLTLPPAYPKSKPTMVMISKPKIVHPNWWEGGLWCEGSYNFRESLGALVSRMMATIQFDPDFADIDSPADRSVLSWYKQQLALGAFPFDNSPLPDPKGSKIINERKRFKIKKKKRS